MRKDKYRIIKIRPQWRLYHSSKPSSPQVQLLRVRSKPIGRRHNLGQIACASEWGLPYLWKQLSSSGVMALCWRTVMHRSAQWLISALLKEVIMPSIPLVVINDYKITFSYQQLTHPSAHPVRLPFSGGVQGHNGNHLLTFYSLFLCFLKEITDFIYVIMLSPSYLFINQHLHHPDTFISNISQSPAKNPPRAQIKFINL